MKQRIRVVGIVRKQDDILLLKRSLGRREGTPLWELPTGKIKFGEQPEESMARAVFENINVSVDNVKLKDVVTFIAQSGEERFYNLYIIYDIQLKEGEKIQACDRYNAYKFVKFNDPQSMASIQLDDSSYSIMDIELGRTSRPIFDGITNNLLGSNLSTVTIHIDGASRGNPGPAGIGYQIQASDGTDILSGGKFIGFATSRVSEYYALKAACEEAIKLGIKSVRFVSDSLMLVNQMNGIYKVKNKDLLPLYNEVRDLLRSFNTVAFMHVKREFNREADRQANIAINRHFDIDDDPALSNEGYASTKADPLNINGDFSHM